MALTQDEKNTLKRLKAEGYSFKDSLAYLGGQRTGRESSVSLEKQRAEDPVNKANLIESLNKIGSTNLVGLNIPTPERIIETAEDLKQTGKGIINQFKSAGEDIVDTIQNPNLSFGEKLRGGLSRAFSGGARAVTEEPIKGVVKMNLTQEQEDRVKRGISDVATEVANTKLAQNILTKYQSLSPDAQREINNALGFAEGLVEVGTAGLVGRFTKPLLEAVDQTVSKGTKAVSRQFQSMFTVGKKFQSVDDVISTADKMVKQRPLSQIRESAEATSPELSLQEGWIGLTPDIKGRIEKAGPDLMSDYLDVVNTRNITDTIVDPKSGVELPAPTAYEFGGDFARKATEEMERVLNDTGKAIGQTREKLGTVKAPADQVKVIENQFKQGLDDLGLEIDIVGNIRQKKGAVRKYGSTKDISALSEMWLELQTVKQSPTLTNLIDYRNFVQQNIKFGKSAREISDSVEPFARNLRYKVKEVANNIVGKSEAKRLDDYSNFIEAFNELKSFTDRRAGGEYLLRLALSGRGGEARMLAQTIKTYTGIDLMDHATLMTTVTDMLGNQSQKNLFRQEITKSGIDVARILSGDPSGAIPVLGKFIQDKFLDPEYILREASGQID